MTCSSASHRKSHVTYNSTCHEWLSGADVACSCPFNKMSSSCLIYQCGGSLLCLFFCFHSEDSVMSCHLSFLICQKLQWDSYRRANCLDIQIARASTCLMWDARCVSWLWPPSETGSQQSAHFDLLQLKRAKTRVNVSFLWTPHSVELIQNSKGQRVAWWAKPVCL